MPTDELRGFLRDVRNDFLEGDAYTDTPAYAVALAEARVRVWSAYQRSTVELHIADFEASFECPLCVCVCAQGWTCSTRHTQICPNCIAHWTNTTIAYHVPNNDDEEAYYMTTQQPNDTCPTCRALIW
jgi:hypothetical protein